MIRPYRPEDAQATRDIFVASVQQGARGRYSAAELQAWLPNPAMPAGWGDWLLGHITYVACDPEPVGFMMLERTGYLNMAYVLPSHMGKGIADALYAVVLGQAQALRPLRLTVLASRYAQSFFARHGWLPAPDLAGIKGLDPSQGPQDNPVNRPMALMLP